MAKKKRRARTPRGAGTLAGIPIESLQAELQRRRRAGLPLVKRRARLAAKLASLDAALAKLGLGSEGGGAAASAKPARGGGRARPDGRRGRRSRDGAGLVDTLHKVLTGRVLRVSEAADEVLKAGYKTASKNFRTVINQTLLVNKNRFRNVARGKYTAK